MSGPEIAVVDRVCGRCKTEFKLEVERIDPDSFCEPCWQDEEGEPRSSSVTSRDVLVEPFDSRLTHALAAFRQAVLAGDSDAEARGSEAVATVVREELSRSCDSDFTA
jgi:hypothetical protein